MKDDSQNVKPIQFTPVGYVRTPFTETAQIPKGAGATHLAIGTLDIRADLEAALTDIDGFSHLYVLWLFHRAGPPHLCAVTPLDPHPHGVFATRSPGRPNPIGLTVVELIGRQGCRLAVRGVDMLDGTPVLDIKPYLSSVPSEQLRRGWIEAAERRSP
ncbi:MAG: tRNA (N6-threonylcarbamoyladenosine(37)-N6)-methyltransferase TrmO [Vicinamibacterales bacterium]